MRKVKNIFNKIDNMKIRSRLTTIYIIIGLIPMVLVGGFLISRMKKIIIERTIDDVYVNAQRLEERLNETIRLSWAIADKLYFDKEIQRIVSRDYTNVKIIDIVNEYENYDEFDYYIDAYKEIHNIRLYVDNQSMLDNSRFLKVTDSVKKAEWYKDAVNKGGKITFKYVFDEITRKDYLALTRLIKDEYGNKLGVLVINISNFYIESLIKEEPYRTIGILNNEIVVLDSKNENVGAKIINIVNIDIPSEDRFSIKQGDELVVGKTFIPDKFLNDYTTFTILTMVPVKSMVGESNKATLESLLIIVFATIISFVLILYFSNTFSKRIIILQREIQKVAQGNLQIKEQFVGKDEIGDIYSNLYTMVESIKELIHEVYEVRIQKEQIKNKQKEAEFKMLASQINPHFLYNTLETIRMKAHCNKQSEIAETVKILAKILRKNLEIKDKVVTLESEITLLENYLKIQKFRFGDRLNYTITKDDDKRKIMILPLILQPIVENAVIHGLEGKRGGGNLLIEVEIFESDLIVNVSDNGIGIEEDRLKEVLDKINNITNDEGTSIGMTNVSQRIKLYYGEQYGMYIHSRVGIGTTIKLHLPIMGEE